MQVNLQDANLFEADLQGANLENADLQNTRLGWANLQGASLERVKYNAKTTWPDGFDYSAAGAILVEV
jgi:uncharacterized protein YjbI with pentapeptide repeats